MRTNQREVYFGHRKLNSFVTAIVFIVVGLMFIGRTLGIIDDYYFHLIISWQMLLMVIGLTQLIKCNYWGGFTVLAIGTVFLLPKIIEVDTSWVNTFWPLIFIIIGVSILFKRRSRKKWSSDWKTDYQQESCTSNDGFVVSDNTFGSIKQIVLDPVFKGARIRNTFGGTILDLRRTKLEARQTYIDVECAFGGIEIYLPSDWNLQSQINAVIGGCDDKRYGLSEVDQEHLLIVRGSVTFGGIEFKN